MRTLPLAWPAPSADEVAPSVHLVVESSNAWPPASDESPAGTVEAASWTVERELVGGGLPGQLRGAQGVAQATGSITFRDPAADGGRTVPWRAGAPAVPLSAQARLVASHQGQSVDGFDLGRFLVDGASGTVTTEGITAPLVDVAARARIPVSIAPTVCGNPDFPVEAAGVLAQVARALGYHATPPPTDGTVIALPCRGDLVFTKGTPIVTAEEDGAAQWVTDPATGQVRPDFVSMVSGARPMDGVTPYSQPWFLTLDVWGSVELELFCMLVSISVGPDGNAYLTCADQEGTYVDPPVVVPMGLDPVWPNRVQVQLEQTLSGSPTEGTLTQTRVRGRSALGADWSAWCEDDTGYAADESQYGRLGFRMKSFAPGTGIAGVLIHDSADDAGVWAPPTATIPATGLTQQVTWTGSDLDAWGTVQQIASASLGAVTVTEDNHFLYLTHAQLRGVVSGGIPVVQVEDDAVDLPWSQDSQDFADRVEVTWSVPDIAVFTSTTDVEVYVHPEPVLVRRGAPTVLDVDLDWALPGGVQPFVPVWATTYGETAITAAQMSRWAAATARDGGGTQPADNALTVTAAQVGPSRVRLTLRNNSGSDLWTVDGTGAPTLVIRAARAGRVGTQAVVARGVADVDAKAPVTVEGSPWVQDARTAARLARKVWQAAKNPAPVIGPVQVVPDLGRQVGDVIRLRHAETDLDRKFLVTGISLEGDASGYRQTLTVCELAVTLFDLSQVRTGTTLDELGDLYAGANLATLGRDPLRTVA